MKTRFILLPILAVSMLASVASGQIVVESSSSQGFGTTSSLDRNAPWTVSAFDAGAGDKLVVSLSIEANNLASAITVTFDGTPLTQIVTSDDASTVESNAIYFLDGVSGTIGDIVVDGPLADDGFVGNGPGVFAASLSGAEPGFETVGAFGDGEEINGTLTGTLTGVSDGAYTIAQFGDQGNPGDIIVTGDLLEVGVFNGDNGEQIGSAVAATAAGFGTGADLTVGFSDNGNDMPFQSRSHFSFASFAATPGAPVLLGDVDMNGAVDFFDIQPFIDLLSNQMFQDEADINGDGTVDFFDIQPFIDILSAG